MKRLPCAQNGQLVLAWENLLEGKSEGTNPGSNFFSFPGSTQQGREVSECLILRFAVASLPANSPLPPGKTQISFPDSCPLKGRKVHFSLLLFILILK